MEQLEHITASISDFLWGWPMIILLLGTHLFLTIRLRFPQRKIFTAIRLSIQKDNDSEGDVSQFGALTTSLAATIGTGNIIGVATAVAFGGPGAVFWCWLTGVFGIATKYAEGLLAIKYRIKTSTGEMLGGPMYALERGLKQKWLGVLFCIFTALALVPLMALFYIAGCIYILFVNRAFLGESLQLIISSAFTPHAAGGGFLGTTVMMAARYGIARGLFSNESGLGSAPIVAAAAQTRNPVRQALVSSTGTFWDTVVICALTGLVLVSSVLAFPDIDYTQGGALTKAAFGKIPYIGTTILAVGILTFAFSTILGWTYYSGKAIEYLGGRKWVKPYRIVWIICVYLGSIMNLQVVWNIADSVNALMAIPNLISLLLLSGVAVKETQKYLWEDRLHETSQEEIPLHDEGK